MRICVFAGSRSGTRSPYLAAARELGQALARRGIGVVYGGGGAGLMGSVADAVLAARGEVIGVMPRGLFAAEAVHRGITRLIEVEGMHQRKALMGELASAFIALPGGMGTFEELFEAISWAQLSIHHKPVGLLDVAGYYRPLLSLVDHAVKEGFVPEAVGELITVEGDPEALVDRLAGRQRPG